MKSQFLCLLSAVAAVLVAGGAYAAEIQTRTWTDATGNHRWDNTGNWDPQIDGNHNNIFPAGRDWEVIVAGTPYYHSLQLPEGSGKVTFNGGGQLQPDSSAYIQVGAGREMNVDGIVFRLCLNSCSENAFINGTLRLSSKSITLGGKYGVGYHFIGGDAKIIVEGGSFGEKGSYLCLSNNATMTVLGGTVHTERLILSSPDAPRESITRVRLLGGTLWNDSSYAYTMYVLNGAHFEFLGGRLLWGKNTDVKNNVLSSEIGQYSPGNYFAECLPKFGCELVIPTCSTNAIDCAMRFHYSNRDYDFGGTVYATNNCNVAGVSDAAAGNVYFAGDGGGTLSISGGATIYANAFKFNSNKTFTNNLDLTRLNLGIGGICRYQNAGSPYQYVNFLDGIAFGAWGGDVARSGAYSTRLFVRPQGPVVYDTQDCFDPATSRTINMDCIRLDEVTDFKATGGGTVALYPSATWTGEFRTLEVADNTTLAFCSSQLAGLKAMNMKLGANAVVKINMKNGDYVDASSTAEFGDGAKIVVTGLPATLAEGMFYPVYFAPAGTDPDLSKIEYAEGDWPAGWSLAKTGNAVYLTDGTPPAYSEHPDFARYWSGAGGDNYFSNVDNWVEKASATDMGIDVRFYGRKNTDIYVDKALRQRSWYFYEDSGPFMFSGEEVTFQAPWGVTAGTGWGPTIVNLGKFPFAASNTFSSYWGIGLWLVARKQGSISLMGSGCRGFSTGQYTPLFISGDIRIGGACTSEYVRVANNTWNSSSERTTRLTIMPGGSFKALSQSGDFNERGAGALAVARGGTVDIGGTQLLLTSNNMHYVDGSLTVTCPLVAQGGRQTFRGDGTLTIAGGVSGDGGIRVEGDGMTLVTGKAWDDVALSFKDNVTVAPTEDWTFRGASLGLSHHSKLTIATGGNKVTLYRPIVSETGTIEVTGDGLLVLTSGGSKLGSFTMPDGATIALAGNLASATGWSDLLTVREDDPSIKAAFAPGIRTVKHVDENGFTVYRVKGNPGMMIFMR